MKLITEEIRAKLREPLPAEAVKPHPTKTYLSSIKAIYVVERLNNVFGVGMWKVKNEIIDNKTSHIVVKATLTIPEYGIELEAFGGNDNGGENSKNFDLGDAYKGASTDALTKICSFLEIGIDVFKGIKDPKKAEVKKPELKPESKIPNEPALPGQVNHAKDLFKDNESLFTQKEMDDTIDVIKNTTRANATKLLLKLTNEIEKRKSDKLVKERQES